MGAMTTVATMMTASMWRQRACNGGDDGGDGGVDGNGCVTAAMAAAEGEDGMVCFPLTRQCDGDDDGGGGGGEDGNGWTKAAMAEADGADGVATMVAADGVDGAVCSLLAGWCDVDDDSGDGGDDGIGCGAAAMAATDGADGVVCFLLA